MAVTAALVTGVGRPTEVGPILQKITIWTYLGCTTG